MRRLIYYEIKKHFFTKPMFIFILIFVLANAWKVCSVSKEKSPFSELTESYFKEAYEELYEDYKGELTEEKVEDIMALYNSLNEKVADQTYSTDAEEGSMTFNTFSDLLLLEWCFISNIEYERGYEAYANDVVKNAIENVSFYQKIGNQYEARVNYKIAKAFYERKLPNFQNTDGYRSLIYYDFSGIIILLLTLFGCSSVFIKENETEMNLLLKTSTRGRTETFVAKMIASILFLIFICLLFSVEDYILFAANFGNMDAFLEPIYMLEGFKDTLLNINLFSFYGVCIGSRILGIIAIGTMFMLVSLLGKNSLQVILANIGILAGLVGMCAVFEKVSKFVNPLMLFYGRKLFMRQNFVRVFGYPFVDSAVIYIFSVVIIIVCVLWMKKRWKRG